MINAILIENKSINGNIITIILDVIGYKFGSKKFIIKNSKNGTTYMPINNLCRKVFPLRLFGYVISFILLYICDNTQKIMISWRRLIKKAIITAKNFSFVCKTKILGLTKNNITNMLIKISIFIT